MKNKRLLGFIAGLMMIPLIGGCNSFFNTGSENGNGGIANVTHQLVPEGVEITIIFDDDSKEPVTFIIPKGTAGVDGNSIESVVPGHDDSGNLTITINFSNPDTPSLTLPIPSNKGIKKVHHEINSDGNTIITIEYTDGTFSDPIPVYKGQTGLSVVNIEPVIEDDGSTTMKVTMSDNSVYYFPVPTGTGIESIETDQTDDKYILTVHYTTGDVKVIEYDKPNRWHQVTAKPGPGDFNDGDFAFDMVSHKIYTKQNGVWILVADLNTDDSIVNYEVRFDLNANDASLTRGQLAYTVANGKTMYSEGHTMPEAYRANYTFEGWYTVKEPTVVNGAFTDLTPVVSDMTLYAVWKAE